MNEKGVYAAVLTTLFTLLSATLLFLILKPVKERPVFLIHSMKNGPCAACDKDGENFVAECQKGTLHAPLCHKCLGRQIKMRTGAKSEPKIERFNPDPEE